MLHRRIAALLLLPLGACVASGPSAVQAMQRLPGLVGTFVRAPLTRSFGADTDTQQVAVTGYQQIAGTAGALIFVPNAPSPDASTGFAGTDRVLERTMLATRLRTAREGGTLTARGQLTATRDNVPVLRCWVFTVTLPAGRPAPPLPPLRTDCVGLVVDRFVTIHGFTNDQPMEMRSVIDLGIALVLLLRDPNAPAVTQLRPLTGGAPAVVAPPMATPPGATPAPDPAPTTPAARRGRAYSL